MNKVLLGLIATLSSASTLAGVCPINELKGNFNVVDVQGCESERPHITKVENHIQANTLVTSFTFTDSNIQKHWIEETTNASSVECLNTKSTQSWRWYPQSENKKSYWGFANRSGVYYAEVGANCRYKLEKL